MTRLRLAWQPYIGYNLFDRYEIYRIDSGCDKSNARHIGSINAQQQAYFIECRSPGKGGDLLFLQALYFGRFTGRKRTGDRKYRLPAGGNGTDGAATARGSSCYS